MSGIELKKLLNDVFPSKYAKSRLENAIRSKGNGESTQRKDPAKFSFDDSKKANKNQKHDDSDDSDYDPEEDPCSEEYDDDTDDDEDTDDEKVVKDLKMLSKIPLNIVLTIQDGNYDESDFDEGDEGDFDEGDFDEGDEEEEEEIIITPVNQKNKKIPQAPKKKTDQTCEKSLLDDFERKDIEKLVTLLKSYKGEGEDSKDHEKTMELYEGIIKKKTEVEKKKQEKKENKEKKKLYNTYCKAIKRSTSLNDKTYFKKQNVTKQKEFISTLNNIRVNEVDETPYRIRILESSLPYTIKAIALQKIQTLMSMDEGNGEYFKIKHWIDNFMLIPFGKYKSLDVNIEDGFDKCNEFMLKAKNTLDNAVYGLNDAKMQILQLVGQWITNGNSMGSAIAIKGPMGTGKTTLVKEGISKILNRPFAFIALGGSTDSSFLEGHSYTYEGSTWGHIVEILKQSKCMNPVIYFDELDKVSETAKGDEIIGILTHLTDSTQNTQFHDKYFNGIDLDLSKCLFIFSYNDESKINPILRDRMYKIQTEGYNCKEKHIIAKQYLIPSIERNIGFKDDMINIHDHVITSVIEQYTKGEKGVRNLKRCIEIMYTKLNMYRLLKPKTELYDGVKSMEMTFPYSITTDTMATLLKKDKQAEWIMSLYT